MSVLTSEAAPQVAGSTIEALASQLRGARVAVLTGAGCSTESGIPDYRGPEQAGKVRRPIQGPEFVRSEKLRQRYWARAVLGWATFRQASPNAAHLALARMQRAGLVSGLITQNVDGLHAQAGSAGAIELHGTLSEVRCLVCGVIEGRDSVQARLLALNPGWLEQGAQVNPDGDAELEAGRVEGFRVAECQHCGGALKPAVVFFGDNVPREVVDRAMAIVDGAEALLVVGSSLAVFSGYRFLLRASQQKKPVAIVNVGPVRGEGLAAVKVEQRAGLVLPALEAILTL